MYLNRIAQQHFGNTYHVLHADDCPHDRELFECFIQGNYCGEDVVNIIAAATPEEAEQALESEESGQKIDFVVTDGDFRNGRKNGIDVVRAAEAKSKPVAMFSDSQQMIKQLRQQFTVEERDFFYKKFGYESDKNWLRQQMAALKGSQ